MDEGFWPLVHSFLVSVESAEIAERWWLAGQGPALLVWDSLHRRPFELIPRLHSVPPWVILCSFLGA